VVAGLIVPAEPIYPSAGAEEGLRTLSVMALNTLEWGDGDRTAVLIHGMMGDSRSWWEIGPALAERGYRVVAVDLPGYGRSRAILSCSPCRCWSRSRRVPSSRWATRWAARSSPPP
jgi:pimeloyl-ACP methyl ester carboxylesterase